MKRVLVNILALIGLLTIEQAALSQTHVLNPAVSFHFHSTDSPTVTEVIATLGVITDPTLQSMTIERELLSETVEHTLVSVLEQKLVSVTPARLMLSSTTKRELKEI